MQEGFSWLQDHSDAYCVTFARGLGETELLRRFEADLSLARLIPGDDYEALEELGMFGDVIQVGWCNGWAFAYEDNGFAGTLPEVLRRISAGTTVVSVFRNINAVTRFSYAEDGALLTSFEPFDLPSEDTSPQVQELLRKAKATLESDEDGSYDSEDEYYDSVEAMFALAEAAGVRFEATAMTERPLLTSFVRNPVSDFIGDVFVQGGDEQTVSRLLALLEEHWRQPAPYPLVAERIERLLEILLSVQAIESLLNALREADQGRRAAVAEVLKALIRYDQTLNTEGTRERLLLLASASTPEVALQAAVALWSQGDQRAIEPLIHVLSLYPREKEVVRLLGQLHTGEAIEALLKLIDPQDREIDFQRALFEALVEIGDAQVAERLLPLLRPESAVPMPTIREDSTPQEWQSLQIFTRERAFQQEVLQTLGRLHNPDITEPLLKLLNPHARPEYADDFQIRLIEMLGNLGDTRAIEPLAQLLDPNIPPAQWRFQDALVKALKQLGDTRAEIQTVEEAVQRIVSSRQQSVQTVRHVMRFISPQNFISNDPNY